MLRAQNSDFDGAERVYQLAILYGTTKRRR